MHNLYEKVTRIEKARFKPGTMWSYTLTGQPVTILQCGAYCDIGKDTQIRVLTEQGEAMCWSRQLEELEWDKY